MIQENMFLNFVINTSQIWTFSYMQNVSLLHKNLKSDVLFKFFFIFKKHPFRGNECRVYFTALKCKNGSNLYPEQDVRVKSCSLISALFGFLSQFYHEKLFKL